MRYGALSVLVALLVLSGCTTIGPKTVPRDRFDYNTAIADSWKEQTLLNIVKLRYADMPLFVEVASVVSGYSLESGVNLNGTISGPDTVQGDFLSLGASGKFTDRPTITYAPITGSKFNQSFMQPIPPKAILFLVHSGWPADYVLPITLSSINGYRGRISAGKDSRQGDLEFYQTIELLRKIQKSGAVEMRVVSDEDVETGGDVRHHRGQGGRRHFANPSPGQALFRPGRAPAPRSVCPGAANAPHRADAQGRDAQRGAGQPAAPARKVPLRGAPALRTPLATWRVRGDRGPGAAL